MSQQPARIIPSAVFQDAAFADVARLVLDVYNVQAMQLKILMQLRVQQLTGFVYEVLRGVQYY
jgi:hypothetical protein